ncbi:hypothetical protein [Moorena sp. SIOASIH]|nr:hypothetical protein [Moorena sp. SIOASIH]
MLTSLGSNPLVMVNQLGELSLKKRDALKEPLRERIFEGESV